MLLQFKITIIYLNITKTIFLWCKVEFLAGITPVTHDPSEIILRCWFAAQEMYNFKYQEFSIINVYTIVLLNIFVEHLQDSKNIFLC